MIRPWRLLCGTLLALLASVLNVPAVAQATVEVGDHVLYASAIGSLQLTPEVARRSGITRSSNRALLNIAIRQRRPDGTDIASPAAVSADAINDSGQRQILSLREVREGDAIYYLAEPRIGDGETLLFEISARPVGGSNVLQARFRQTFFAPLPQ
jgi:hypothetical protein